MSITSSISELISSFVSIIQGILASFYHAIETVFATASSLLSSIADLMSGFVRFMLDNIVIIGFLVAAFVAYSAYQQQSGRNKKGQLKTS